MQKDSRLAWGLSLLTFGVLFLIRQLNILPESVSELIYNFKNYPLILSPQNINRNTSSARSTLHL